MIRFLDLIRDCRSPHWDPQWQRMEPDFWEVINFVGKIENIEEDSRRLLEKIGAWDAVGKSGWGPNGEDPIFNKNEYPIDLEVLGSYTPVVDRRVEEFYKEDYGNNLFSFTKKVSSLK